MNPEIPVREKIISTSIELLKKEGLKFSVDSLAATLKISKKTVYKYFSTKEALAFAIFERAYCDMLEKIDLPSDRMNFGEADLFRLLSIMEDALVFSDEGIFNRFSLNENAREYAVAKTAEVWKKVSSVLAASKYGEVLNERCFYGTLFSSLKIFTQSADRDALLASFISLIFKAAR